MNDTEHDMQWEHYVYTMTKHKLLQRMEEFAKDDCPSREDYYIIKACTTALLNVQSIQAHNKAK